jgi:uncharacterized protein
MKSSEGTTGRVFILRLEDGDVMPDCVEQFAVNNKISVGQAIFVGGVGSGQVVSGPRDTAAVKPEPMMLPVDGVHEIAGIGTIAPDESGRPVLHMHAALGRSGQETLTGCIRPGITTWVIGEVIIYEILGTSTRRAVDKTTGFTLMEID